MTVPQAAEQLGMSRQLLRVWIQKGNCPFGCIIKSGKKNAYYIDEQRLNMWRVGAISNDGSKVYIK